MMCHNGEMLENIYEPQKKNKKDLKRILIVLEKIQIASKIRPMTLEGCVVEEFLDIIAYIGRDIEDCNQWEN